MKIVGIFLALCLILMFGKRTENSMRHTPEQAHTYLALGDSYTIGESVEQKESFPYQLADQLRTAGLNLADPRIIATTGWTTGELQVAIKNTQGLNPNYDLVTLLIGVNNQYRGQAIADYQKEFRALLTTALKFAGGNKGHVFVLSIPDWSVTPFAEESSRSQAVISKEIDSFNEINKKISLDMGVSYTDITPGSRLAATDRSLLAKDGLHPSRKMYAQWVADLLTNIKKSWNE